MAQSQSQFSLSWDAHKKNISTGLSDLQQRGEFVDMTLAADGHLVKVHQLVMALASPYIKELITSADCKHPVIFLNKVSYSMLSALLEYIYTGEVLVARDKLTEFVEAGKELHIKGLEDVKLELSTRGLLSQGSLADKKDNMERITRSKKNVSEEKENMTGIHADDYRDNAGDDDDTQTDDVTLEEHLEMDTDSETTTNAVAIKVDGPNSLEKKETTAKVQYTISAHGSLQMILNRYIYSLRYSSRVGRSRRCWRCVSYERTRCPASAITQDDIVVKRSQAHNHPYYDRQILKRVRDNLVYAALDDALTQGQYKKQERMSIPSSKKKTDPKDTDTE